MPIECVLIASKVSRGELNLKIENFIHRTEELIVQGQDVLKTKNKGQFGTYVNSGKFLGFRSACLSFLSNLFSKEHPYYLEFDKNVSDSTPSKTEQGIGVLYAVKNELEGGWIRTTKGLIASEIFSDFLEMSSHLFEEGYKDPAAVMAGSVLAEHLRNLCEKHEIETHQEKGEKFIPKKASALNAELAKHQVITKLDEKAITAWLDLRNKAAHGKYEEYTKEQVGLLIQSIIDFMLRVQA